MFFFIPGLLTFGILYLIGEWLFASRFYRWMYIIITFLLAWTSAGLGIWYRIGLGLFLETTDALGNQVSWFSDSWSDWITWIASVIGVVFLVSMILCFVIIWPFSRKKWWQFWKK